MFNIYFYYSSDWTIEGRRSVPKSSVPSSTVPIIPNTDNCARAHTRKFINNLKRLVKTVVEDKRTVDTMMVSR